MSGNYKIVAVLAGFYFYGEEVKAQEGYIALKNASMFGGFSGGKGVAGVARGDKAAKVTLDRFDPKEESIFPLTSVIAIMPSIDLYKFSGTTLR